MRLTQLQVKNWRNFQQIDFRLGQRLIIVGANATGKSNLMDVFRFLRDVASPEGGLSAAVGSRGGVGKIRYLNARNFNRSRVEILAVMEDDGEEWTYNLAIGQQDADTRQPVVAKEVVRRGDRTILERPDESDERDPALLTQTHLEQIASNGEFRAIARFFESIHYSHPAPQSIRHPTPARTVSDAAGDGLIAEISSTGEEERTPRLEKIEAALRTAVPGFESLELIVDRTGQPHLEAAFENWRKDPVKLRETEFSDGTLRLIALLWAILSQPGSSPAGPGGILLLEEPEIALNREVISQLPAMIGSAQRGRNVQVVMTTHSPNLLDDEGIAADEILVLDKDKGSQYGGTRASLLSDFPRESALVLSGVPKSEVISNLIDPGLGIGFVNSLR